MSSNDRFEFRCSNQIEIVSFYVRMWIYFYEFIVEATPQWGAAKCFPPKIDR